MSIIKISLVTLIVVTLCGCAGMKANPYNDLSGWGMAWQVGHIADVAQTLEIVDDTCYKEGVQNTAYFIGEQPSTRSVLLWGIGSSYLNAQIDQAVGRSDLPKWGKAAIRLVNLGYKYNTVTHNYEVGIRIGTDNKPDPNKCRY